MAETSLDRNSFTMKCVGESHCDGCEAGALVTSRGSSLEAAQKVFSFICAIDNYRTATESGGTSFHDKVEAELAQLRGEDSEAYDAAEASLNRSTEFGTGDCVTMRKHQG